MGVLSRVSADCSVRNLRAALNARFDLATRLTYIYIYIYIMYIDSIHDTYMYIYTYISRSVCICIYIYVYVYLHACGHISIYM